MPYLRVESRKRIQLPIKNKFHVASTKLCELKIVTFLSVSDTSFSNEVLSMSPHFSPLNDVMKKNVLSMKVYFFADIESR